MITRNSLIALGAAALLTASIGLAQTKTDTTKSTATKAATAAKTPAATKHVMTGTIESVSGSGANMSVVIKGAKSTDKPVTVMLNDSTTKKGDLVQGAKVTANYHVDNGQNIATSITVAAAKTTSATSSTATKTK